MSQAQRKLLARKKPFWDLHIYWRYYKLTKSGHKTLEVRVAFHGMKRITKGMVIRFNDDNDCKRRVKRVAPYASFAEMLRHEDAKKIDPDVSKEDLLAALRAKYPPEKEKYGVLVFELEPA